MLRKLSTAMIGAVLGLSAISAQAQDETIEIGWTAWADAEFVTKLAAQILEERMDRDVELIQTSIAPQYQGVAEGDIDLMMMAWLPQTHADYWERVGQDVINLGILYGHAKLGWAVPTYVPEDVLGSIEDLKKDEVKEKLDGTITGIDPGAGLSRLSKKTVEEYGLEDYHVQFSSGAGMAAALDRAIKRDEWIVVTLWNPHWAFGAYDLRYLEDPKGTLGQAERIHVIARKGFYQDNPDAALFLERMFIDIDQLQSAMFNARETSYEEAINQYIESHPKLIDYWVTGKIEDGE